MSDYELGEMDRRMACLTQSAIVEAVTYDPPRVKVRIGDWVSDWLKWQAGAAGKVRHWRPPSVDEEVALWAPSGDLAGRSWRRGTTRISTVVLAGRARMRRRSTTPMGRSSNTTTRRTTTRCRCRPAAGSCFASVRRSSS